MTFIDNINEFNISFYIKIHNFYILVLLNNYYYKLI